MFSKKCCYGIRAAIYMATLKQDEGFVSILQISDKLNISFHYLTKILQALTKQNIIFSYRGPKGGVTFVRPPDSVSLFEIVDAIDGQKIFTDCTLGLEDCGNDNPCPLHEQSIVAKNELRSLLETTTLEQLAHQVTNLNLRLSK